MTTFERPLIALEGGPKDRHWYWLADWRRHVEAVRAQRFPLDHPANRAFHYQPTGRRIDHANPKYGQGEVWRYTPPQDISADPAGQPEVTT